MTNDQLSHIHYAIQEALNTGAVSKGELLSWTLTYLIKQGDAVIMKTIWIPQPEKKE